MFVITDSSAQKDAEIRILQKKLERKIKKYGETHVVTAEIYYKLGLKNIIEKNYVEALQALKQALQIQLKLGNEMSESSGNTYHQLGISYKKLGHFWNALSHFDKAVEVKIRIYGEKSPELALTYQWIGITLYNLGYFKKAIHNQQKALYIYSGIHKRMNDKNYKHIVRSYRWAGVAYFKIGNYNEALRNFQLAIDIVKEICEENPPAATLYQLIGITHFETGKLKEALNSLKKSLQIHKLLFGKKHEYVARSNYYIGRVYYKNKKFSEASEYFNRALSAQTQFFSEKSKDITLSRRWITGIYYIVDDHKNNLLALEKDLKMFKEVFGENHSHTASCLEILAMTYLESNNYEEGISLLQKVLQIRLITDGKSHINTSNTHFRLGSILQFTNNYKESFDHHKKSLKIRLNLLGDNHKETVNSFHCIGSLFLHTGDFVKAIEQYKRATEIAIKLHGENHMQLSFNYNGLANAYSHKGDYEIAIEYYHKALEINIKNKGERSLFAAINYYNLGSLYYNWEKYDLASINLAKAYSIHREHLYEDKLRATLVNWKIGELLIKQKKYIEAEKQIINSIKFLSEIFNEHHNVIIKSKVSLAINYELMEDYFSADSLWTEIIEKTNEQLNSNYSFLFDDKKILYLDFIKERIGQFFHFMTNYGTENTKQIGANLLINIKSQILDYSISTRQLIENTQDENLESIFLQLNLINQQIAQSELLDKDELKQMDFYLDSVSLKKEDYAAQILSHPQIKNKLNPSKVSWQQIQEKLKADEALIDYFSFYDKIDSTEVFYAMLIKNEEAQPVFIPLSTTNPVINLLQIKDESENSIKFNVLPPYLKYKESRQEMYGYIWQAFEPHYFEDHQAQYELEEDTLALRLPRDKLTPLPATLHEVNAIESICAKSDIHPTLLTIAYFSGDRAPGIIHFATHGAYLPPLNKTADKMEMASLTGQDRFRAADNPLQRSMLMLYDGILTALEVTNLDLSKTKLVVLSACNSGIGSQHNTEGVFGLPRAFKLAGADKILVSLWPVHDEITKELMILFYTNLLEKKQPAATALRNAKAEMRKRNDIPKFWAGFILVE